ncbi:hypothetical protein [Gallaecimonas xiamenensis]|nr:hypothetical protein [Gallaecimonas xiamenensis]
MFNASLLAILLNFFNPTPTTQIEDQVGLSPTSASAQVMIEDQVGL